MLATLLPICCQIKNFHNKNNTINTINNIMKKIYNHRNINSIINTISTNNIKSLCTCGSGKKYKQCCGKNV